MSPSLLAHIPKCSKDCHERFRLDTGEWTDSSDESYTESEAPNSNPPQKKVESAKGRQGKSMAICGQSKGSSSSEKFVPKSTATSTKWAVSNFVAW